MKFLYIIGFFLLTINISIAQNSEVGITAGTSVYSGDLSPQLINIKFLEPAIGLFYRYNFNPHWSAKGSFVYCYVSAYDSASTDLFQKNRNLHFRSNIIEFALTGEFNFFEYVTGDRKHPFTPYIFGGIAIFNFNPQAKYIDGWVNLQPLGTEGQRLADQPKKEYSLSQISLPFGIGIKWSIADKLCLGFEIGARKTFTDYLDDVSGAYADKNKLRAEFGALAADLSDRSLNKTLENGRQRGNASNTDWYTIAGITLSYNIGKTTKVSCDPFKSK